MPLNYTRGYGRGNYERTSRLSNIATRNSKNSQSRRDALGPPFCHATRLTWEGHEFLDKIKNESIWKKVKATARSKGVDLSFTVIKDIAKALIASVIL